MGRITIGILAHVDAGKTTLSEALLYSCGMIRKLGRVDHRDAFLDTFSMERERGITIFSKQAELTFPNDLKVSLLDTPGHVDFSAEMERTLRVLDYAVLVINGADGVQSHTRTLWKLLKSYEIPTFIFVNKMDQAGTDHDVLYRRLKKELNEECIEFQYCENTKADLTDEKCNPCTEKALLTPETYEALATCDEHMLNEYVQSSRISDSLIRQAVRERRVFPCIFGSALKLDKVDTLIRSIAAYTIPYEENADTTDDFSAIVYKITRDNKGARLTHMKIMSGTLRVKETICHKKAESEKVDQLRIYSGDSYTQVQEVSAGTICAAVGLEYSYCGEGLGNMSDTSTPVLEPVLMYQLLLPDDTDVHKAYDRLRQLEEENPLLHMTWEENSGEIQVQVMGEVELDILRAMIEERYGLTVSFGAGSLVYKETVAQAVTGVGHYEPLKHYAEVQLLIEPAERGTGIQIESMCGEDVLSRNWQRLIMTHIGERRHAGVLTGSELTDVKITLINGKAHTKHTEGGDFRQATYRAIRQGLMKAENILLEPVYDYTIELPVECSGRAMSDIQQMNGTFTGPEIENETARLSGMAPVSTMFGYQRRLQEYTHGMGRMFCNLHGYQPCHNTDEMIEQIGYDAEADLANPADSVFCEHGAGTLVQWDQVEERMHLERYAPEKPVEDNRQEGVMRRKQTTGSTMSIGEDEIREIYERTYGVGSMDRKFYNRDSWEEYGSYGQDSGSSRTEPKQLVGDDETRKNYERRRKQTPKKEAYLLVDGYNVIFAWDELKAIAESNLDAARNRLMDIMCNYQGYRNMNLILVFDAYKVSGNNGSAFDYHNIHVVYTKEAQTADQYIEKFVHEEGGNYDITVATSDGLEQLIVMGAGAKRLSSRNLLEEVELMEQELREKYLKQ